MIETLQNMLKGKLPEPAALQTEDFTVAIPSGFRYVMEDPQVYYKLGALARLLDYAPEFNYFKGACEVTALLPSMDPEELNNHLRLYPVGARLCYLYAVTKSLSRSSIFKKRPKNPEYQLASSTLTKTLKQLLYGVDDPELELSEVEAEERFQAVRGFLPWFVGLNFAQAYNDHTSKRPGYRKDQFSKELNKLLQSHFLTFDLYDYHASVKNLMWIPSNILIPVTNSESDNEPV